MTLGVFLAFRNQGGY